MKRIWEDIILFASVLFLIFYLFWILIIVTRCLPLDYWKLIFVTIITPFVFLFCGWIYFKFYGEFFKKAFNFTRSFIAFDYNKNRANEKYKFWFIGYLFGSGLYFLIFATYFYFAGFKDISLVIFLAWFGLIFVRLLHFYGTLYSFCLTIGNVILFAFIPFGVLLLIGYYGFTRPKILWIEMAIYIFYSFLFILSTLLTEIFVGMVKKRFKK